MNKEDNVYLKLLILLREWNQEWIAYDNKDIKLKPKDGLKLIEELKTKFNVTLKNE